MLFTADLRATELTQKSGKLFEKEGVTQDLTSLDLTFAEVMQTSPVIAEPDLVTASGEALPKAGELLPPEPEMDTSQLELPLEAGRSDPIPERLLPEAGDSEIAVAEIPVASLLPAELPLANAMGSIEVRQQAADTISNKNAGRRTVADTEGRVPGSQLVRPQLPQPVIPVERIPISVAPVDIAAITSAGRSVAGNDTTDVVKRLITPEVKEAYPAGRVLPASNAPVAAIVADRIELYDVPIDSQRRTASPGPIQATPTFVDAAPMPTVVNAATRTPSIVTTISQPVSDTAWEGALQNRVLWMTSGNIQSAEVRLNPSELGPIRIRVTVEGDLAQLTFAAQHPVTREAIEMAMPRLREMLGDNGLSMAGFSVSDEPDSDVRRDEQGSDSAVADDNPDEIADAQETPVRKRAESALVDTFV